MPPLSDQEFQLRADESLGSLYKSLVAASDSHEFEADLGGALTIEFEDPPARFVVSPNSPVRQIWVSAHSKSFKLDWDPENKQFQLPDSGQSLKELMQSVISQQLGTNVELR